MLISEAIKQLQAHDEDEEIVFAYWDKKLLFPMETNEEWSDFVRKVDNKYEWCYVNQNFEEIMQFIRTEEKK